MLNPSARDTQIVSVGRIWHFLEYCCPNRANHAVHESFLQRQLLVIQQLSSETFIQFGGTGVLNQSLGRQIVPIATAIKLSLCLSVCPHAQLEFPYFLILQHPIFVVQSLWPGRHHCNQHIRCTRHYQIL